MLQNIIDANNSAASSGIINNIPWVTIRSADHIELMGRPKVLEELCNEAMKGDDSALRQVKAIADEHGIKISRESMQGVMRSYNGGDSLQPIPNSDAGLQNVIPGLVSFIIPKLTYRNTMDNVKMGNIYNKSTLYGFVQPMASLVGAQDYVVAPPAGAQFYTRASDRFIVQGEVRLGWFEKGRQEVYSKSMYGPLGINPYDWYMKGLARAFAIFKNACAYYGVSGIRNYGRLNSLNPPTTIPAGASGSTNLGKMTSVEIYNVIVALIRLLNQQSGANITSNTRKFKITVASNWYDYFYTVTSNISGVPGYTAKKLIEDNYPGSEIIGVPEYNSISGGNNLITVEPMDISFIDKIHDPSTDDRLIMPFSDSTDMTSVFAYQDRGIVQGLAADGDGVLNKRGTWAISVGQGSSV